MKTIGIIASTIIASIFSMTYNGYALTILWGWFIMPIFNVPSLNIPVAIGIAMVVSFLTYDPDLDGVKKEQEWSEKFLVNIVYAFLKPTFALFFGWIITLFL